MYPVNTWFDPPFWQFVWILVINWIITTRNQRYILCTSFNQYACLITFYKSTLHNLFFLILAILGKWISIVFRILLLNLDFMSDRIVNLLVGEENRIQETLQLNRAKLQLNYLILNIKITQCTWINGNYYFIRSTTRIYFILIKGLLLKSIRIKHFTISFIVCGIVKLIELNYVE